MPPPWSFTHLEEIKNRALGSGGFEEREKSGFRPDATAWAILVLSAAGTDDDFLESSRRRLALQQSTDGRIGIFQGHPEAFWPTPLAALALQGSLMFKKAYDQAIHFLTTTAGKHWKRESNSAVTNDTDLMGWPWVGKTFSWVEPTSLSLIALRKAGNGNHPRVSEGIQLLLDRQLPTGGWNYGNKIIFGQELHPLPGPTGLALQALAGRVSRNKVKHSINYLNAQVAQLHTPLTLGWTLLGLAAWSERPKNAEHLISECLERQSFFRGYNTSHLSLLLLSFLSGNGLISAED